MTTPLVSIVVPVYNAEKFLSSTISSVLKQNYSNWELILIDDCSTDNSVQMITEYLNKDRRITLIRMTENSGAALSRNAGTAVANGRYLAFLDADDIWVTTKLKNQVLFMQENGYRFTYAGYEFADTDGITTGKKVSVPSSINYKQALKNHIISTPSVMIDLSLIDRQIVYMPNVRSGQDAATWWQILRHIDQAYGMNETMFYYRRSSNSLSANKLKAMKRTWYLFTKVEKLSLIHSAYNFMWYGYNATKKRI